MAFSVPIRIPSATKPCAAAAVQEDERVPLRHAEEGGEADEEDPFVETVEGTEGALPRARRHQPQVTCVSADRALPQCHPADLQRGRSVCRPAPQHRLSPDPGSTVDCHSSVN